MNPFEANWRELMHSKKKTSIEPASNMYIVGSFYQCHLMLMYVFGVFPSLSLLFHSFGCKQIDSAYFVSHLPTPPVWMSFLLCLSFRHYFPSCGFLWMLDVYLSVCSNPKRLLFYQIPIRAIDKSKRNDEKSPNENDNLLFK